MKTSIAIATINGTVQPVLNLYGSYKTVAARVFDRKANGEAFKDEHIIRLPPRLTYNPADWFNSKGLIIPRC